MKKLITFFLVSLIISCSPKRENLKLLKVTEHSSSTVSDSALTKLFKTEANFDIDIDYTLSEDYALKQLENKKVDLVIIPNNAVNENVEIKSITSLLPRLLMIYTNKNIGTTDLKELFETGQIYFEDRSRLDSLFFDKLYYSFDIDKNKINENPLNKLDASLKTDSLLVYVGLTHLNNKLVKRLTDNNWSIYSLDNVSNYGKGSKVEGFTLMNSSMYPFLIPMNVYKNNPDKPVLTIAIKDILIAREDLDNDIAYEILRTLTENKAHLVKMNKIYNLLNFNTSKDNVSFPLHQGAINYIEKDKPSIILRWINVAWPVFSLLVILIGAISSIKIHIRKKLKKTIDSYYHTLLEIQEKVFLDIDEKQTHKLLSKLNHLKIKAINNLANNKYESGESFNVFLALYSEIKNDLNHKLKKLQNSK